MVLSAPAPLPAADQPPATEERASGDGDDGSTDRPARPRVRAGWPAWLPPPARTTAVMVVMAGLVWSHFWRLTVASPPVDESVYASTGWEYVHGVLARNQEHPPLAKYLFGAGQLVFGQGVPSARLVAAGFGVLTGVFMMLLARQVAGFWAGVTAGALWWLLPLPFGMVTEVLTPRLDRFAMLDGVMASLAMAALCVGWRWVSSGGWLVAVGTGALAGLATAAKLPAVAALPVILAAGLLRRHRWSNAGQAAALGATACAAFLATYVPFGYRGAVAALRYMIDFQTSHEENGHLIYVFGHVHRHAPWWTVLAYQWIGNGPLANLALLVACLAAVLLGRRNLGVWYVAVAGALGAGAIVAGGVAQPHYGYAWLPQELTLTAVGLATLAGRGRAWAAQAKAAQTKAAQTKAAQTKAAQTKAAQTKAAQTKAARSRAGGWAALAARPLALVLAAALLVSGAAWQARLAVLAPADYALLPTVVHGTAPIVVAIASPQDVQDYLPDATVIYINPTTPLPGQILHIFDDNAVAAVIFDPTYTLRNSGYERMVQQAAVSHHIHRQVQLGYLRVWLPG
jgi:hypothetical protein